MLKTASILTGYHAPEVWDEVIRKFDFLTTCNNGHIPHILGKMAFGYCQPTLLDNEWTKWLDKFGWDKWVIEKNLDGMFVDTPFLNFDYDRLMYVKEKVGIIIPNFGDFGTWTMRYPAAPEYKEYSKMLQHLEYQVVQCAYDMRYHTEERWRDLRHAANLRLSVGKTLILGIYDPGRNNEMLSALLTHSMSHPKLFWHYYDALIVTANSEWNNYWDLAK